MVLDDNGLLIVISGPSGVGKGEIRKRLFQKISEKLVYSISMTTREVRPGEIDGKDYYFVSREKFEEDIQNGNLLEYAQFVGNYYGTPRNKVEEQLKNGNDVILEIEVNGAKQVQEKMPNSLSIFIVPPSLEELERRLQGRGTETPETIKRRLARAKEEIPLADLYDYVVVNDEIETAADQIVSIINSAHLKTSRVIKNYYKTLHDKK